MEKNSGGVWFVTVFGKSQREKYKYIYTKYVLGYQNHKTDDQRASSKFWKKKK